MTVDKAVEGWMIENGVGLDELDAMARNLAEIYVRYRRVKYPSYRPSDSTMGMNRWRKIAIFVRNNNVDPDEWIRVLFDMMRPYPEVGMLASQAALSKFKEAHSADIEQQVAYELELFAKQWVHRRNDCEAAPEAILKDPNTGLGSLFIWCFATMLGVADVAAAYRSRARILLSTPAYIKVYTAAFPQLKEAFNDCVSH